MNRVISSIAAVVLALSLTGCGGEKSENISDDLYETGCRAVDVTEEFLSMDISADEYHEKISVLHKMSDEYNNSNKSGNATDEEKSIASSILDLNIYASNASTAELKGDSAAIADDMAKIRDTNKKLKDRLGYEPS